MYAFIVAFTHDLDFRPSKCFWAMHTHVMNIYVKFSEILH